MTRMQKIALALVAALSLGAASVTTLAGPGCGHGGRFGDPEQRAEYREQRHQERMALLESQLALRDDQQAAWDELTAKLDAHHEARMQRGPGWRQGEGTAVERLNNMIGFMEERLNEMKAMAVEVEEFYNTLDAEQQATLDEFFAKRGPGSRHGGKGPGGA